MNSSASPDISEQDLHAYVDGELSPARRIEVETYLGEHADAAARVRAYQEQNHALKALFNPVLAESVPPRLQRAASAAGGGATVTPPAPLSPLSPWSLQRVAASLVLLAAGAGGGWIAHEQLHPPLGAVANVVAADTAGGLPGGALAHQAAIAHVVYSPDVKRPVEIGAEQEDQLIKWLSKRLGADIRPPKLGALGFELIGGRLLPGASGPVAQFMYHDQTGQRLTVYVSTENTRNQDTAFRFAQEGPVNVFYWIDGKFGYALSAGIAKDQLARVATAVYAQYAQSERQPAAGAPRQDGLR